MRLKIWCDGESEKFCKFFLETKQGLNTPCMRLKIRCDSEFWKILVFGMEVNKTLGWTKRPCLDLKFFDQSDKNFCGQTHAKNFRCLV